MSQIDRRLKNVQQADLTESRVNDDFVHWLRTWGSNILLVVLIIAAAAMAFYWWDQRKQRERDDAWSELGGATLPAALVEVAQKHQGKDSVARFAQMKAADAYLLAVLSGKRFDREATAPDAQITPELRAEWLKEADRLYAQVASSVGTGSNSTGDMGFLCGALFGRAAIAEDNGDIKAAEGFLKEVQERSKETDFKGAGELAAKRIATLGLLANKIDFPSRPAPVIAPSIPNLGAATAPSTEDIVRQLQGGAPTGINLTPVPDPLLPTTAPAPAPGSAPKQP